MVTRWSAARVRDYFDTHAGGYDQAMSGAERWLLGEHRRWATSRARGDVLEVAVGTGLNLALYGQEVTSVVGIDLSPSMLALANQQIEDHHLQDRMRVQTGDAQDLDVADATIDTVVATYALCTIPEPGAALAQPGGCCAPAGTWSWSTTAWPARGGRA